MFLLYSSTLFMFEEFSPACSKSQVFDQIHKTNVTCAAVLGRGLQPAVLPGWSPAGLIYFIWSIMNAAEQFVNINV